MAKFDEVIQAVKDGRRIRHEGWYDGQSVLWQEPSKHLLISKEKLLSDKWEIEKPVVAESSNESE